MKNYLRRFRRYLSDGGHPDSEFHNEDSDPEIPKSSRSDRLNAKAEGSRKPSTVKKKKSRAERNYYDDEEEDFEDPISPNASSSVFESSEEESSTARLSRRSSVLLDLFALFRRSSSFGRRASGRRSSRANFMDSG